MGKGDITRAAILEMALAETSQVGLMGLSIGALARRLDLSKSGLFAHFESKEDLQLQVLLTARARFIDEVITQALRNPRGEPRVRALFERWLDWHQSQRLPGGCVFLSLATELDDQPGRLRDELVQNQKDWLDTLATAARIAVDEGHFRRDLDATEFAYDLYSIILGFHHLERLLRDPASLERGRDAFERLLQRSRL